ncbi:MerC domain-containing protein [Autumnicola musiva]|uniref:MerC domain-containing protein n=1 Tax=Autumnicola musiva TaxID=3075589 RepID=A0ABU3DAP6_9FLAO|nr:MerC domain-containing protein [Zunongwangia sp. F117]MDT0678546.1 MerC domain-containing protein [Zunongwangia sp. F117]
MKTKQGLLDVLGLSGATLCAIHCLFFPLIAVIPIGFKHNHWIDLIFALVGLMIITRLSKKIKSETLLMLLWFSISLVIVSACLNLISSYHSRLIYLGSLGLIIGHFINYKKSSRNHVPKNLNQNFYRK